jgi:hypothetical protein
MPTKKTKMAEQRLREIIRKQIIEVLKEEDVEEKEPDPEIEKEFKAAMDKAMGDLKSGMKSVDADVQKKLEDEDAIQDVIDDNPEIKKLAKECYSRARKRALNESHFKKLIKEEPITLAIGILLAAPKLMEIIGKVTKVVSKALGGEGKAGEKLEHVGHKMHEAYLKSIIQLLKGMVWIKNQISKNKTKVPDEVYTKYAKVIYIVVVATLGGVSAVGAVNAIQGAQLPMSIIESILAAVKSGEVATELPSILSSLLVNTIK